MWELVLGLIKSAKSVAALEKVKTVVTSAYHGEKSELGDFIFVSNRRYAEIMRALNTRMKELDESSEIIDAFKDLLL